MALCMNDFNGEHTDKLTGLQHLGNGYRGYSPTLFRFLCRDDWSPFGAGGLNGYTYCDGDPLNHADPSGHMSWQIELGIGLSVLGLLGTLFTSGASLAASGCLSAGLAAASGISGIADVTGIVSATTTDSHPRESGVLSWLSLATGIISLGVGLGPEIAAMAGKLNQALGGWLQGSISFLSKIERRGHSAGIPLSGEFLNSRFLGRYQQDGQMQWSFRYEDNVPVGRRLNIVIGSDLTRSYPHPQCDVFDNDRWVNRVFSPSGLRDSVMGPFESFNIYRLVMPYSGSSAVPARISFASRLFNVIYDNNPVSGFTDIPLWQGPVADNLQSAFSLAAQLENAGHVPLFDPEVGQYVLNRLSERFGNLPESLMFSGDIRTFPFRQRRTHFWDSFR